MLIERYPSMVGHHLAVLHSTVPPRQNSPSSGRTGPTWYGSTGPGIGPAVVLASSSDGDEAIPLLEGRYKPDQTLAYLCTRHVCAVPTSDPDTLADQLGADG